MKRIAFAVFLLIYSICLADSEIRVDGVEVTPYIPYSGADSNVDLGSYNLITTGTIAARTLKFGTQTNILPAGTGTPGQALIASTGGSIIWANTSPGGTGGYEPDYVEIGTNAGGELTIIPDYITAADTMPSGSVVIDNLTLNTNPAGELQIAAGTNPAGKMLVSNGASGIIWADTIAGGSVTTVDNKTVNTNPAGQVQIASGTKPTGYLLASNGASGVLWANTTPDATAHIADSSDPHGATLTQTNISATSINSTSLYVANTDVKNALELDDAHRAAANPHSGSVGAVTGANPITVTAGTAPAVSLLWDADTMNTNAAYKLGIKSGTGTAGQMLIGNMTWTPTYPGDILAVGDCTTGSCLGAGAVTTLKDRVGIGTTRSDATFTIQNTSSNFILRVANSNAADVLAIQANGNVGIGLTNPSQKLDVVGNIKVSGTMVGASVSSPLGQLTILTAPTANITTLNINNINSANSLNTANLMITGVSGFMGNVGIGVSNPLAKLDIRGAGTGLGIGLDIGTKPMANLHIRGSNTSPAQGMYCEGCYPTFKIGTTCWAYVLNVIGGNTASLQGLQVTCPPSLN